MTWIHLTPASTLLAVGAVTIGATVQGSLGFGMALVSAPFLLLIDRSLIPGPLLAVALVLTALIALRERHALDGDGFRTAIFGRVLGTAPAALAAAVLAGRAFDSVFAALVLAAVAVSLCGVRLSPVRRNVFVAGALSGLMGTLSSIGGPPMALVYQNAEGPRIRATLSCFFAVGAALSLGALAAVGRFGIHEAVLAAILLPGAVAGFTVSRWTRSLVDGGAIRPLVLCLSFTAGIAALWRALG